MAFGRTTNILNLLTCVVNYPAVANAYMKLNCTPASSAAVERLFSASAQVLTARRCLMQEETLDLHIFLRSIDHSQTLKHDVDIPDNLGAGQAVGGGRQYKRYRLAVSSCSS